MASCASGADEMIASSSSGDGSKGGGLAECVSYDAGSFSWGRVITLGVV